MTSDRSPGGRPISTGSSGARPVASSVPTMRKFSGPPGAASSPLVSTPPSTTRCTSPALRYAYLMPAAAVRAATIITTLKAISSRCGHVRRSLPRAPVLLTSADVIRGPCASRGHRPPRSLDRQPKATTDHEALDLARPLADLEDLRVAIETGHGGGVDEAVAAEDLRRLSRRGNRRLRGVELGHRRRLAERPAGVPQPRRFVGERSGALRHDGQVRTLERHALVGPDRATEGAALGGVADRVVEATFDRPDGQRSDRDPALVEDRQKLGDAAAPRPE